MLVGTPAGVDRFLQKLDGSILAIIAVALLVMQPSKLLQNLGVIGIAFKHTHVSCLCIVILHIISIVQMSVGDTHIFLLLVNMTNLKPDILLGQRIGWKGYDISKALWESVIVKQEV